MMKANIRADAYAYTSLISAFGKAKMAEKAYLKYKKRGERREGGEGKEEREEYEGEK